MLTLTTRVHVERLTAKEITDFMLRAGDAEYQRWWPGTHLRYRFVKRVEGGVGSVVWFDEYVGPRRLRLEGEVLEATENKLVIQLRKFVPLPGRLIMEMRDVDGGVDVTHTIRAGFGGVGRVLDPLLRLYFSPRFQKDMDAHATTEFKKLGEMLHPASVDGDRPRLQL